MEWWSQPKRRFPLSWLKKNRYKRSFHCLRISVYLSVRVYSHSRSVFWNGTRLPYNHQKGTKEGEYILCDLSCCLHSISMIVRNKFPVRFLFRKSRPSCRNILSPEVYVRSVSLSWWLDTMRINLAYTKWILLEPTSPGMQLPLERIIFLERRSLRK